MADRISEEARSYVMSRVGSKNTKPEIIVRSFLHKRGFRFRLHKKELPGKPDIVLNKYKSVIFVNGCFWHRHKDCPRATMPTSNIEFWKEKFRATQNRDRLIRQELENMGWVVLTVWECELKPSTREKALEGLEEKIYQA